MMSKKSYLKLLSILFIILCCGCLSFAQQVSTPLSKPLSKTDTLLFERVSNLLEVFETHGQEIWGASYQLDKNPLMFIYRNSNSEFTHAYLLNNPKVASLPTAQFVKNDYGLDVYKITDLPNKARLNEASHFDFQVPIAGKKTFVMIYNDAKVDPLAAPVSANWDAFVAHEGLHDQQFSSWKMNFSDIQDKGNYPLEADDIASIWLEHKLLIDALQIQEESTKKEILKSFVAVRSNRMEQNNIVKHMDGPQERYEGTALYLEYQLAKFIPNPRQISLINHLEMTLSLNAKRHELAFGRFYSTGAALSSLLDDLGLSWKQQLEDGSTQYEVLSKHFALSTKEKEQLLSSTRNQYDYGTLQEKAFQTTNSVNDGYDSEAMFEDGEALEGEILEEFEKPYETVTSLIITSLPKSYEFSGGFTANPEELGSLWSELFNPASASKVHFFDYKSKESQHDRLRITKAVYKGKIDDVTSLNYYPDIDFTQLADVDVAITSFEDGDFNFTEIAFAYQGYWYVLSAPLKVDTLSDIALEIIQ